MSRRLPEGDQPVGATEYRPLNPVERRRIAFDDVLKGGEDERHPERCSPGDLCGRCDVRLLPAVDEIPRLLQQPGQLGPVQHRVHATAETNRNRDDPAALVRAGLCRMPPEIAAEPQRRDRGHVPFPKARQLLRQTAVQADAVRMADRQQPAGSIRTQGTQRNGPAWTPPGLKHASKPAR